MPSVHSNRVDSWWRRDILNAEIGVVGVSVYNKRVVDCAHVSAATVHVWHRAEHRIGRHIVLEALLTRDNGAPVFTRATSASALVFFVLAMQCLPTLAVTRRETGALKYAVVQLTYMSSVAWIAAFVVFQGLRAMGVS